jgi:hypothetical protein
MPRKSSLFHALEIAEEGNPILGQYSTPLGVLKGLPVVVFEGLKDTDVKGLEKVACVRRELDQYDIEELCILQKAVLFMGKKPVHEKYPVCGPFGLHCKCR